jgi:hypothetical protein
MEDHGQGRLPMYVSLAALPGAGSARSASTTPARSPPTDRHVTQQMLTPVMSLGPAAALGIMDNRCGGLDGQLQLAAVLTRREHHEAGQVEIRFRPAPDSVRTHWASCDPWLGRFWIMRPSLYSAVTMLGVS